MTSENIFQTGSLAFDDAESVALLDRPVIDDFSAEIEPPTADLAEPEAAVVRVEVPAVTPQPNSGGVRRPLQILPFLRGFFISGGGLGLMMLVVVGVLRDIGVDGSLSLPVVAICMVMGLMMLGGGFGIMATAAPRFDDGEFDRLLSGADSSSGPDSVQETDDGDLSEN